MINKIIKSKVKSTYLNNNMFLKLCFTALQDTCFLLKFLISFKSNKERHTDIPIVCKFAQTLQKAVSFPEHLLWRHHYDAQFRPILHPLYVSQRYYKENQAQTILHLIPLATQYKFALHSPTYRDQWGTLVYFAPGVSFPSSTIKRWQKFLRCAQISWCERWQFQAL
jgi:hypothetical protein